MMYLTPTIFAIDLKDYMLPCLNKKLLGVDCPGCGMQRAVDLLLHGDFIAAFYMYPAIYPIVALLVFLLANIFFSFKHAQQVKWLLLLFTAGTIIVSYIIKMNNLFN